MTRQTALSRVLNFTEDDLTANGEGRLSETQRARLRSQMVFWGIGGGLMFLIMALALIGLLNLQFNLLSLIGMAVVGLLMLVFGAGTWIEVSERWFDLYKGVVLSVTGEAELYVRSRVQGVAYHSMKIGGLDFPLPDPVQLAFYPGDRYEVFYTPKAKIIMSAVRLDEPDAPELN